MVVHSILLRCLAQDEKCVKAVSLCFHLWHCLIQSVFDFSIIYVKILGVYVDLFCFDVPLDFRCPIGRCYILQMI